MVNEHGSQVRFSVQRLLFCYGSISASYAKGLKIMLGKMLLQGLVAAVLIGSGAAVYAQATGSTQEGGTSFTMPTLVNALADRQDKHEENDD